MKILLYAGFLLSGVCFSVDAIAAEAPVEYQAKGRTTSDRGRRTQFTPPNSGERPVTSQGRDAYRTGGNGPRSPQPFTPPPNDGAPRQGLRSAGSR